jgi:hypothetical protein
VIEVRPVETEADIDTYVEVRTRVHPETPMPREVVVEDRKRWDHLDLLAYLDGVPVGAASTSSFGGAPNGEFAYLTLRVVADQRRSTSGPGSTRARSASRGFTPSSGTTTQARSATTAPAASRRSGVCRTSSWTWPS